MTINIRDTQTAPALIGVGASVFFDQAILAEPITGGTAVLGTRVVIQVQPMLQPFALRVAYSFNGPDAVLVFLDRGTVDFLALGADFRSVYAAVGTNMRFLLTNIGSGDGSLDFYSALI